MFALAAILRFLTPAEAEIDPSESAVYRGWFDGRKRQIGSDANSSPSDSVLYADGLSYNLIEGWYEFRCTCNVGVLQTADMGGQGEMTPLPALLLTATCSNAPSRQPADYENIIHSYLVKSDGGNLSTIETNPNKDAFIALIKAVSAVYARMVAGDGMMNILKEMDLEASCACLVDGE